MGPKLDKIEIILAALMRDSPDPIKDFRNIS